MHEIGLVHKRLGILDQVPIGVLLLKHDYTVLFWNSCMEDWTGIQRADIMATDIRLRYPHLATPQFTDRLLDIFAGGPPTVFSAQIHGRIIPIDFGHGHQVQQTIVTSTPSLVETGYYALFSIQDVTDLTHTIRSYRAMRDQALAEVTERKKAEANLLKAQEELESRIRERTADLVLVNSSLQTEVAERKHAEQELKKLLSTLNTLVEHIPGGVVLLDPDYRIVLFNTIGREYLSILSPACVGEVLSDISGRSVREIFQNAQATIWHEITVCGSNDRTFEISGSVIGQSGGSNRGTVLVITDVTDERIRQERLHTQERLAAVGQLAAGIAHDFNNILTGIIGFTEVLLSEGRLGSVDSEILETVRQSGLRAAYLIRQILDFSRKSNTEMQPMEMAAFLNEFSKFIRRTIQEKIHVSLVHETAEYIVRADPTKIQQVLTNLSLNARDAMPEGGTLTIALLHRTVLHTEKPPVPDMPDGNWVVLSVADNGCGMPSEIIPHIFEPFFTTKDTGKGTGLGLAQVYGIIKQHGGFIDVNSIAGKGSVFTIYLPVCAATELTAVEQPTVESFDGQNAGILVVEDYEAVRSMISSILSKLNFTIYTAENGKEALEVYEQNKDSIRLIITDLVMPEMDGIEMSRIIKSMNPAVKILAISGYPLGSEWKHLYEAGITECIQKPFERLTLIHAVCSQLKKGS